MTKRNIMRAIWYWGLDHDHAFSTHFRNVRLNFILMSLVLADPRMRKYCDPNKLAFIEAFVDACMEHAARPEEFGCREQFLEIWALRHDMRVSLEADPEYTPSEEKALTDRTSYLTDEQLRRYGPAIALQWLDQQRTADKMAKEQDSALETGIEDLFADIAVTKASEHDLSLVDWDSELMQSVLVEIDESVGQTKPVLNTQAYWMAIDTAFRIVRGE
ncbi:hypothetical protein CC86DRAFT_377517 [Ophiobolus disseminans]|uniref:Uncharacterized protein n=1 Tax=Ophiobolus disseminans TaxID=1469910 RepID=A0A6A7AIC1_9PLEO|nr:hypothetical protein CC86DRAFT_377517 [Ophiobolus disseminans]